MAMLKEELMDLAKQLAIPGRAGMTKEELQDAIADYHDDDDSEVVVEDGTVRLLARRWDRFLLERDNRPSEGESDLLTSVTIKGRYAVMPVRVAKAFGLHPSFYEST